MLPRCVRVAAYLAMLPAVGCSSPPGTVPRDASVEDTATPSQDTSLSGFDLGTQPDIGVGCDPDGLAVAPPDAKRTCRCPKESPSDPEFADSGFKECMDCEGLAYNRCFTIPGGPLAPPDLAS